MRKGVVIPAGIACWLLQLDMAACMISVQAGPSITLAAAAETLSFALGALTPMPAVRNFSLVAAVAVLLDFFLQVHPVSLCSQLRVRFSWTTTSLLWSLTCSPCCLADEFCGTAHLNNRADNRWNRKLRAGCKRCLKALQCGDAGDSICGAADAGHCKGGGRLR